MVEKKEKVEVIKAEVTLPREPGEKKDKKTTVEVSTQELNRQSVNKETVFYLLYLLLKSNMISRNNLKQILNIVNEKTPDNLAEWLVKEAAKG